MLLIDRSSMSGQAEIARRHRCSCFAAQRQLIELLSSIVDAVAVATDQSTAVVAAIAAID